MEDASVHLGGGNPGCGDLITMYVKVGDVKSRVRCATLALGTLQAAVDQFQRDRDRREAGLPPIEVKPFEV
jgi:NifU-like protein involved in Fe-S cluster formation